MTSKTEILYPDGVRNKVSLFSATTPEPADLTLLCLPAMGVRASYYQQLAEQLSGAGYHVLTADWRGLGHSSVRASRQVDFGYAEMIEDLGELLRVAENQFPGTRKVLLGHSIGAQLGSLFAARFPEAVDALILIATGLVYYKGWQGVDRLKVKFAVNTFAPLSRLLGYFPGHMVGFAGREARSVMKDWSYNGQTGNFNLSGSDFDYEAALGRLQKPLLAITVEKDALASRQSMDNLLQKFHPDAAITHHHLTAANTGISALDHFSWAKEPAYVVGLIKNWLGGLRR